jgi:hypothetical protein
MKQDYISTHIQTIIKCSEYKKYYNIYSNFDTTKFRSDKVYIDAEAIHSMIQGQHLILRYRP